jgi:hypothetical protein
MGMFLATVVVFLLFVVVSQSMGYLRSRWRVAGTEGEAGTSVRTSAAVGIASGLAVLILLFLLFLGFTRWQWFGPPPSHQNTPVFTPAAPGNQGAPPIGVNVSPPPTTKSSPTPAPTPSR